MSVFPLCISLLGLHSETSQVNWLQTAEIYFLMVLEAQSPRSQELAEGRSGASPLDLAPLLLLLLLAMSYAHVPWCVLIPPHLKNMVRLDLTSHFLKGPISTITFCSTLGLGFQPRPSSVHNSQKLTEPAGGAHITGIGALQSSSAMSTCSRSVVPLLTPSLLLGRKTQASPSVLKSDTSPLQRFFTCGCSGS